MAPQPDAALYPPLPEDEDWDEHLEGESIESEMHYLYICPDRGSKTKSGSSLAVYIPPRLHDLHLLFPIMFNANGNNIYQGLDMNLTKGPMDLSLLFVRNI
jgi:hypothetical protein